MDKKKIDISRVKDSEKFKIDYTSVRELREIDFEDKNKVMTVRQTLTSYKRTKRKFNPKEIVVELVPRPNFDQNSRHLKKFSSRIYPKGKMMIIVSYDLYPEIKTSIDQYVRDLANEGYYAYVYRYKGGSAAELRQFIIKHRARFTKGEVDGFSKKARLRLRRDPIQGVVLVGNLPVAMYENTFTYTDSDTNQEITKHEIFPCDLFFMDTNGVWSDIDGDGDYTDHSQDVDAEIWVGRIWTPDMGGNNAKLITNYFHRNHLYRTGQLGYSNKAVAIVDDDWTHFGDCAMDMMLPSKNVEVYIDKEITNANTYKAQMAKSLAWAQICAHSNPLSHHFTVSNDSSVLENGVIDVRYIKDQNPPQAYFYNLFACTNALFTYPNYMAGWYIFEKSNSGILPGLAAIGSTKSGSMLFFENFYRKMGEGKTIGEAFTEWWKCLGSDHSNAEMGWFYGLVLLGDPTLNWWTGAVPKPIRPFEGQVFSHYPRKTRIEWTPIILEGVSVEYHVEVDAYHAKVGGKWAIETDLGINAGDAYKTTKPYFDMSFCGANKGRWRVRAKVGDKLCPWSKWVYFEYTK